jgi:hypothetical protein
MSEKVEGVFEVIECEDGKLVVRHLATDRDYEIELAGSIDKFLDLLPLGSHFIGSMVIEHVHLC